MIAGTLAYTTVAANADPPGACFTEPDNEDHWSAASDTDDGVFYAYASFRAYGEHLAVFDHGSNNSRAVVRFSVCEGSRYGPYKSYDSGPNEGEVDTARYELGIREGRKVKFKVCEGSGLYNCSDVVYAHA